MRKLTKKQIRRAVYVYGLKPLGYRVMIYHGIRGESFHGSIAVETYKQGCAMVRAIRAGLESAQ